ncbi:uncharacterized protein [Rutidosis leptorrhynchoides]|uniref:uncharacterized protein n=1 Tax=Rutidosis leptorrhynchoides TaxID=125765 RepID=UPI003A98FE0A
MPFGLKKSGATYQRVIDEAFKSQIGINIEAYVDDLVIKSSTEQGLLEDILETFASLRKINMKLNPSKCGFGEEDGKFLGHIITERGIRANPKKIEAIESMSSPKSKKEVQSLTGKLAALTRFLSKSAERSPPFFATADEDEQSWMTPIADFSNACALPADAVEARKIKMKVPMYLIEKGILNRKSFLGPHLRCLNLSQVEVVIREVHEGLCALHSEHKAVASKIMRLCYYWPSMYRDAAEVIDNGTQFEGNPFKDQCQELNVKQTFTLVTHPQANGQCEVTNCNKVLGIKARLGLCQKGWVDELPNVLWAHRTTPKGSNKEMSFSLVYGSKAVIPAEVYVPTRRVASFDEGSNSKELHENLNLVEERTEMEAIQEAINKQKISNY